jgi:importin subunit beta-1
MAAEVATEGKDPMARQLAGIYLKNVLYAKNETVQVQKHEAWKAQSVETRQGVKQNLLVAMRSPEEAARKSAATAAAEVAAIEVPFEAWPEFLPNMLENVTAEAHPPEIKVAALTCLGYTCERMAELDNVPEIATTTTDAMLTTIVDGLLPSRPDIVRLAATTALSNSLLFTHSNMERKEERDAIMSNICEATTCADARVRKQAFNCINTVAYHYYEKLPEYMVALFEITTKTISSDQEEVATEAIEFWSVIAETEDEMQENEQASQRYAHQAVGPLVPLLLEAMTKQDEHADLDMDQFGLSMAAGTCLGNLSMTVADDITAAVLPFVQENIQNENWHFREAATMAFACVLEGVTPESIAAIVHQSIPVLMGALNDPVDLVKDTTLYTISKICENHSLAIPGDVLPTLVNGLISKLPTEPPQVAKQASNALHKLGMAFDGNPLGDQIGSNQLSPFLPDLLQQLMAAADRPDANECGLRVACFEAINVFIQNAAPDCKPLLLQLFPALVDRLGASFGLPASEARDGLQGLLCSSLQVMCQSLDVADIVPHADKLMTHFLQVLQVKSSSAQVEALSAISAMADALGPEFEVRHCVVD